MTKRVHEIRDPIHVFIHLGSDERRVVDCRVFQRLRHIHQLALTYLVYPGASHQRFEHALGVMELAGRVFDIVTADRNLTDKVRDIIPSQEDLYYWRRVLRMAALCHDIGHLPFSHGAEDLLPRGYKHENLTVDLLRSPEMEDIWKTMIPPLTVEHLVKVAVGPKVLGGKVEFSAWERILTEILTGDAFGVDRMDYLLRDSLHAGVAYGRFDHYRLIETIRILPSFEDNVEFPMLGIEEGGIHAAEALLLARYFMFTQLYLHPIRRIYDIHLKDFLTLWLKDGKFSINLDDHLRMTDNEVLVAIQKAAYDSGHPAHDPARRIFNRQHFKILYGRNPKDLRINREASRAVYEAACEKFGSDNFRHDSYKKGNRIPDYPVLYDDGRVVSALSSSNILAALDSAAIDFVFVAPELSKDAHKWLEKHREEIIQPKVEAEP
jgi:HD superfamily phosphohydrolase